MRRDDIRLFLDSFKNSTYDARRTKNVRFADQKCTPDLVCFIADCILSTECATKEFTNSDLWRTTYFKDNSRIAYNKPYSDDKSVRSEYDKVCRHPLTLLASAHVLNRTKKKGRYYYTVNNSELLDYIARNERSTLIFLYEYFTKIIIANGLQRHFDEYKEICSQGDVARAHTVLYKKFRRFIKANSGIKKDYEPDRILHKILNVFAIVDNFPGSSGKIPTLDDLTYNKLNRRDKNIKAKDISRGEAESQSSIDDINDKYYIEYIVTRAKKRVKKHEGSKSEVDDDLATGVATTVHHIFPKAQYPALASLFENLILLTGSQHVQKAHPNHNNQVVSAEYQYVCLMAKSQTIENSIARMEDFYSKEKFIHVICVGLDCEINSVCSFEEIRRILTREYIQKA